MLIMRNLNLISAQSWTYLILFGLFLGPSVGTVQFVIGRFRHIKIQLDLEDSILLLCVL